MTAINECLHVYQVVCVSRRSFVDKPFAETAQNATDLAVPFLFNESIRRTDSVVQIISDSRPQDKA